MRDRRNQRTRIELLYRVRSEFLDMPGLRLTREQASKLLAQRLDVCERVLQQLEKEGLLKRVSEGAYCRSDLGA
jgi:hypothetical protein